MFYSYITFYYIITYLARFIWKNHACTYRRIGLAQYKDRIVIPPNITKFR